MSGSSSQPEPAAVAPAGSPVGEAHDLPVPTLPRRHGRRPRVALLVYNDAHADSRVLKTTATLREAGAEVRIFASARELAGYPAGDDLVDGLPVHRAPDLELVKLLPGPARLWRRLRGRDPDTGAALPQQLTGARTGAGAEAAAEFSPASDRPPAGSPARAAPPGLSSRARAVAADAWMRLYQSGRLTWFWAGTVAEARRWRPDVVHANDANTLVPAMVLERVVGSATVYDSHELWLRRNIRQDRWLAPLVEAVTEHLGIQRAGGVITVSPSIATWLRRRYQLAEEPVLVRNIPRYDGRTPPREGGRLRELAGLGAQDKVVAYTGGITTGRGLEETLEALTLLPADVHLVLLGYGDPAYIARFEARAAELGLAQRVHLVGKVPSAQVPATLADADAAVVFVRPVCLSYRYSLPNKLFESIHAGLPVVAADLPDTAAVVREHGVGEVFDASTPAELAEAIADVLARPEAFRAAAREAAARLTWQDEARRLVSLYDRVLRRQGGDA